MFNEKAWDEIIFTVIKHVFIGLSKFSGFLAIITNVSKFTTCISLNDQPCVTRHTFKIQ